MEAPPELVAAGSRTPTPKTRGSELVRRFLRACEPAVSLQVGSSAHLAYSHVNHSPFTPRLFGAKDDIFCLFKGGLDNLGRLRQHYGLSKGANEVMLLIEAYKTLRDRAPHPTSFMLDHLNGNFSFLIFDKSASTLLVASDPEGKAPFYWGITSDGCIAFCDDVDLLKGSCGKSLAPFPQGCFYSNTLGGLKSYEKPKNKVTAIPADEEELCGATFQVEDNTVPMETYWKLLSP